MFEAKGLQMTVRSQTHEMDACYAMKRCEHGQWPSLGMLGSMLDRVLRSAEGDVSVHGAFFHNPLSTPVLPHASHELVEEKLSPEVEDAHRKSLELLMWKMKAKSW